MQLHRLLETPSTASVMDALEKGEIDLCTRPEDALTLAELIENTLAVTLAIAKHKITNEGCALTGVITSPPELAGKLALAGIDWDNKISHLAIA